MTKWIGLLGGGAAGVAVAAAGYVGLTLSGVLKPDAPDPAALIVPDPLPASDDTDVPDAGGGAAEVTQDPADEIAAEPTPEPPTNVPADAPTDAPEPTPEDPAQIAALPDAQTPEPDTDPEAAAPLAPPVFDLVRVEPDGSALVAGKGVPRSQVVILLDNAEIAETLAGRDGKFVSLMTLSPSPQPRLMTLAMRHNGTEVFSETDIIVAPFGPKPTPVAEPEPKAQPDLVAEAAEPEADTPTTADVAPVEPEVTEPVVAEIAPAEPEVTEPVVTEVVPAEPEVTESVVAEVVPAEPEATEPVVTEVEPAEPEVTEPVVAEATPAEPETTEPVVAEVEPAEPEVTEPVVTEVTPAEPETTEPVVTEVEPDTETPPTLLASDEEGVRVLPGPEVLDRVAIDSISYDDAGEVALAGRGAGTEGGGFVRVYLDNTPITTSRIREDGSWRVRLPEVDKGVYVLRVDEVDEDGDVKSRAETPFQREDRETLERASGGDNSPIKVLTVQPGNTLWQIARERYGEGVLYVRVFDANRNQIRDPDLIYPGQVFDLPDDTAPAE
ncbi:LysM peptidoglycan-binding domain-containing protein [Marinovum sp. 2_MG-2023]|uniref:LysM peptidoglycan-binding domain-containing protein n=1 Tax=unclassified Marinovum TaxID=2647166 RepID=UPI0026E43957|nr:MULTISPECIES: LysM peptidoglycan-binding domain-containing protein [unclassified Marinovum]MDO6731953.1 LysM peptidoglycan-binding domain-containing protein [Marinovum sp. 2_MG-2023]MDO6781205.1 LysM peptidoglycan-binding domain-containing protein [Marinovum sp. 1_MG-2023]